MGHYRKWTPEEDEHIVQGHAAGRSMASMAEELGIHRNTIGSRLRRLAALYEKEGLGERIALANERKFREECRRLEERKPPPFQLWARGMLALSRRERRQEQHES